MTAANDNAPPVEEEVSFETRPMVDADQHFVLSSWLTSYAEESRRSRRPAEPGDPISRFRAEFRSLERQVFFALYDPVVKRLMDRSTILIACLPDAQDVILGWAAFEGDTLHYVFTKPRWRGLRIMRRLLSGTEALPLTFTHVPPMRLERFIPPAWTYDSMKRFPKKEAA